MCQGALRGDGGGGGRSKEHLNHSVRGLFPKQDRIRVEKREGEEGRSHVVMLGQCSPVNPVHFLLQALFPRTIA